MKTIQSALRLNELLDFCIHHSILANGFFFSNLRYLLPLIEAFILPLLCFQPRPIFSSSAASILLYA